MSQLVSVVTPWELGIKCSLRKLSRPDDLVEALIIVSADESFDEYDVERLDPR